MKTRTLLLALVGVLLLALAGAGTAAALGWRPVGPTPGYGLNGGGYGGMMTGGTPFGGMMSGTGMMSGGVMGGGPGGMMGRGGAATGQALTLDQAQQAVQATLDRLGNQDLVIDEVLAFQDNFYAIVKERSTGIGAYELLVGKATGAVIPEYGPNMMWNTKYGMMGWQRDAAPMTISADRASQLAAAWLSQNQPGATTEAPDRFYGYYTLHILQNGATTGMLSVNGYTGQVWYHTWHGAFIATKQVNP